METFAFKKLNGMHVKNSIKLKSQIGLELWKSCVIMWPSIELGKVLERILKLQSKRVGAVRS
jgi:hypothetical protein